MSCLKIPFVLAAAFCLAISLAAAPAGAKIITYLGWSSQQIYNPPLKTPGQVAVSYEGKIAVVPQGSAHIQCVMEDGYVYDLGGTPQGKALGGVAFDNYGNLITAASDGILWFIDRNRDYWYKIATGVHTYSVSVVGGWYYAAGYQTSTLQQVGSDTPDTYASGFKGANDIAAKLGTGEVLVADDLAGAVYSCTSKTKTLLSDGLGTDGISVAYDPNGSAYLNSSSRGLCQVDQKSGALSCPQWFQDLKADSDPKDIAFDPDGRVVAADPSHNHVLRYDLDSQTGEVLHWGQGRTTAMAVNPVDGSVYLGVGHPFANGQAKVVRVKSGENANAVSLPLPLVQDITFGSDGVMYIAASSAAGQPALYSWSQDQWLSEIAGVTAQCTSLATNPTNGQVWGVGMGVTLWRLEGGAVAQQLAVPLTATQGPKITFTPDGDLYLAVQTSPGDSIPVERGVYRVDQGSGQAELVADMSTLKMCCVVQDISAGANGEIYWVGSGDRHTKGVAEMQMVSIGPAGGASLIAQGLPSDPLAVAASLEDNLVYFTTSSGIYQLSRHSLNLVGLAR